MATMPHCDSAVLHAPGECEYCDAYPSWQEARQAWGIAFTGHPPTDEQPLPCPSETHRDLDTINRWPGNRPTPPGRPHTEPSVEDWDFSSTFSPYPTQLGRPNIPVLRKNLEEMIREIVKDVLRDERNERNRGN